MMKDEGMEGKKKRRGAMHVYQYPVINIIMM